MKRPSRAVTAVGARRPVPLALVVLAAGWATTLWLSPWSDERVNDLFVYRVFTEPVLDGFLPYRDVFLEYPPLAAPAIGLPGLIGTGEEVFRWAYAGWTFLLALAIYTALPNFKLRGIAFIIPAAMFSATARYQSQYSSGAMGVKPLAGSYSR